ncbi:hypothetical protein [Variovorax sp. PAMC26660]|uniref:hypothetical protein n=1 Tax=Variovorax sp. PAMC26660 TaxID=2762322 RepID=UPI00164CFFE8|nr:hypothetical protein [Variovorax sp. PAMC26660]QNK67822.1 hypothetical protein H7F35_32650 [Variovorax sp. PAMC26660]
MATLYLSMTEKLSAHWKANNNAYPQKFVLTPAQRHEYDESCRMCGADPKTIGDPQHMGVLIEIAENTPGVMVAADGTEVTPQ